MSILPPLFSQNYATLYHHYFLCLFQPLLLDKFSRTNLPKNPTIGLSLLFVEDDNENRGKKRKEDYRIAKSGGWSALDELMKEQEKAKEHSNRKDYWLREGIIVKVMSRVLPEKGYYKQKGIVHKKENSLESLDVEKKTRQNGLWRLEKQPESPDAEEQPESSDAEERLKKEK
ncbi:hypothetical protein LguiA_009848 [Lonicera macranthoides]